MLESLTLGIAAGLALAIPMGPMALLLIQTTIARGHPSGIAGGLAMASVDFGYALLASLAGIWLAGVIGQAADWVTLLGSIFLIYLAADIFRKARQAPTVENQVEKSAGVAQTYFKFFGATILNPPTALYFLAIAPTVARFGAANFLSAIWFALGVFVGSGIWQQSLALAAAWLSKRITPKIIFRISAVGSILIVLMALQIMFPVLVRWLG